MKISRTHAILLVLLLSMATCAAKSSNRAAILNQIHSPVALGKKVNTKFGKTGLSEASPVYTVSSWYRHQKLAPGSSINLFTLRNLKIVNSEESGDHPFSNENVVFAQDNFEFKNKEEGKQELTGSNASPDKLTATVSLPKEKLIIAYLVNAGPKHRVIVSIPYQKASGESEYFYLTEEIDFDLESNNWIFLSVSIDNKNLNAFILIKFYGEKTSTFAKKTKLESSKLGLNPNYLLYSLPALGTTLQTIGFLSEFNVYLTYSENLEILSAFSFSKNDSLLDEIDYQLLFYKTQVEKPLLAVGKNSQRVQIDGNYELENTGIRFKPQAHVSIGRVISSEDESIVSSPTFYLAFTLNEKQAAAMTLLSGQTDDGSTKLIIKVNKMTTNNITSSFISVDVISGTQTRTFKSGGVVENYMAHSAMISLIRSPNNIFNVMVQLDRAKYEFSEDFKNLSIDFSKMSYTILDSKNTDEIILHHLYHLKSPAGLFFAFANGGGETSTPSKCFIPLVPSVHPNACLHCQNSVLFPTNHHCVDFCPPNTKNAAGICVTCSQPQCAETSVTKLEVQRIANTQFMLRLNRPVTNLNQTDYPKFFSLDIPSLKKNRDYTYQLTTVSSKEMLLNVDIASSVYGAELQIKNNFEMADALFDENRNFVSDLQSNYKARAIINPIETKSDLSTGLAIAVVVIFYIALALILLLLCLKPCVNLNDTLSRKFAGLVQIIQLSVFLLYLNISLPANLYGFLFTVYKFTFGLLFLENKLEQTDPAFEYHSNMLYQQITTSIFRTMSFVLIVHAALFGIGLINLAGKCICRFTSIKVRDVFDSITEFYDWNFVITLVLVFDFQLVYFSLGAVINLFHPVLSFIVGTFYLSLILMLSISFSLLHACNRGFTKSLNIKYILAYFFAGFKNTGFGNFYTMSRLFITILQAASLRVFMQTPSVQITAFFVFAVGHLAIAMGRPMVQRADNFFEIMSVFLSTMIAGALVCMHFYGWSAGVPEAGFSVLGWVAMSAICLNVFGLTSAHVFNFIYSLATSKSQSPEIQFDAVPIQNEIKKVSTDNDIDDHTESNDHDEVSKKLSRKFHFGSLGDLAKANSFEVLGSQDLASFSLVRGASMENFAREPQRSKRSIGMSHSTRLDEESVLRINDTHN